MKDYKNIAKEVIDITDKVYKAFKKIPYPCGICLL